MLVVIKCYEYRKKFKKISIIIKQILIYMKEILKQIELIEKMELDTRTECFMQLQQIKKLKKLIMNENNKQVENKSYTIHDIIEHFSGGNLTKLQEHFVGLYGSDEISQEKANSFAVGFGKACELMIKELNSL
jgi:hypothetical protein